MTKIYRFSIHDKEGKEHFDIGITATSESAAREQAYIDIKEYDKLFPDNAPHTVEKSMLGQKRVLAIEAFTSKISQLIIDNRRKLFSYNDQKILKGKRMSDDNICRKIDELRQENYNRVPLLFRDETIIKA